MTGKKTIPSKAERGYVPCISWPTICFGIQTGQKVFSPLGRLYEV